MYFIHIITQRHCKHIKIPSIFEP